MGFYGVLLSFFVFLRGKGTDSLFLFSEMARVEPDQKYWADSDAPSSPFVDSEAETQLEEDAAEGGDNKDAKFKHAVTLAQAAGVADVTKAADEAEDKAGLELRPNRS
jgi:hypothetical protein